MSWLEALVILLLASALLLPLARRLSVPYPTLLALAGALAAATPWAPRIALDPQVALLVFIAPALLSAAYDTSPQALLRHWRPLFALAVMAVVLTTAAVAWLGWALAGLPLAAAIALGAIVAPPDAAAAHAVLASRGLPRRTLTVLHGEGLLNDAVALLLFAGATGWIARHGGTGAYLSSLALSLPGGVMLGAFAGWAFVALWRVWAGTHSLTVLEFASTFGLWLLAERLHLSAILAVVVFGMWTARGALRRQSARDRIHSFSVWDAAVFLLNVVAFMLMGLQARDIVGRLDADALWRSLGFAALVFLTVVAVRMAWVLSYRRVLGPLLPGLNKTGGDLRLRVLIGWSGLRGVLTLATAMSLPPSFPGRDLVVLSAFAVVMGTLVLQGATIGPLVRWLDLPEDDSLARDVRRVRRTLRRRAARAAPTGAASQQERDRQAVQAERQTLNRLRRSNRIDDDVFRLLQEELDWREVSLTPHAERRIEER
ncbi:cation:proton antiporter [Lysobacter enzymogenes]|uniref:cation:proton antiporter n=1 Tax=Lysobacter enzymogenes TaxID=69 RepID=UPI00384C8783